MKVLLGVNRAKEVNNLELMDQVGHGLNIRHK
mgnify:CR=1 FL=1